ncbi:MAG: rhomboid family intramembrane serine protease [Candidatus Micrarchaeota archaeon]
MLYLIAIIGLIFILQLSIPDFTEYFILNPSLVLDLNHPEQIYRIFTAIFLHANIEHLFFNLLSLFFFAPVLIHTIGRLEFYKIFFIGGIVGSLFYVIIILFGLSHPIPALGASGAIYAILGAVAFFHPESIIYVYFFPMRMKFAIILWVILNLFYIVDWRSGIGGAAHLGGLFFGWFYAKYLQNNIGIRWGY